MLFLSFCCIKYIGTTYRKPYMRVQWSILEVQYEVFFKAKRITYDSCCYAAILQFLVKHLQNDNGVLVSLCQSQCVCVCGGGRG